MPKLARRFVLIALLALAVVPGCGKAADLAQEREQALALAAQYTPMLAHLSQRIETLAVRTQALPAGAPGLDQVHGTLARGREAITRLQGQVRELPGRATDAAKGGQRDELRALVASAAKDVSGGITQVGNDVALAEQAISELERKVKEQAAAAAAASAADAGVPPPDAAAPPPTKRMQ